MNMFAANANDETLGYIAEEPRGFFSMFARQAFRTHRPFRAVVLDAYGSPILWVISKIPSTLVINPNLIYLASTSFCMD